MGQQGKYLPPKGGVVGKAWLAQVTGAGTGTGIGTDSTDGHTGRPAEPDWAGPSRQCGEGGSKEGVRQRPVSGLTSTRAWLQRGTGARMGSRMQVNRVLGGQGKSRCGAQVPF